MQSHYLQHDTIHNKIILLLLLLQIFDIILETTIN